MRLGIIDYINVLPLTYALEHGKVPFEGEITKAVPTKLNSMLAEGKLDAGFISSIEYAKRDYILLPFSISCDREVLSVLLLSHVPVNRIKTVSVTKDSATSVVLLKILLKHAFSLSVSYSGRGDAELVIGDKALKAFVEPHDYLLDLGKAWCEFSKEKMVFAVFSARKDVEVSSLTSLEDSLKASFEWGKRNMKEIITYAAKKTGLEKPFIKRYYNCLSFSFGPEERRGLKKFYHYAKELGEIERIPSIEPKG